MESGRVAFFDFDGTITSKDTMLEMIKFVKGSHSFWVGFIILMPLLILYKLKIVPNWRAKEIVLGYFFNGMDAVEFNGRCDKFCTEVVPGMIRPGALKQLSLHKQSGDEIRIVSSSGENWIRKWCADHDLKYIASKLEEKNGKITGKLNGKNCYGAEKVNRIRQALDLDKFSSISAYGDTGGDRQMLAIATDPHYKPFR